MNKALKKYVGWLMPLLIVSVLIACPTGDTVVPDAPTNVETAPGNTEVTVSWTAPSGTGGADITDYTVYWGTEAAVTTDTTTKKSTGNGSVTSLTITGLTNGTMYYFIVTATNSAGESVATTAVSATPTPFVPDAPTDVETAPGNTEVTVSWTAPSDTGGADITDYTVYWGTEAAVTTDTTTKKSTGNGSVTSLTITGLTNGTMYYFIVTATNSIGESVASTEVSATPTPFVPDAPTDVETAPGNTEVTVSWTAPSGTGGVVITDYTVYWGTEAAVTTDTTTKKSTGNGSVTSLTITGLTNGTMYYFIVTATNSIGESVASTAVSATPATVAPDAPTDVATAPGNTEVTVSWTAPSDTGGADITDYTVYWDTVAAVTTDTTTKKSTGNGSVTSLTITGLTNGLSYYFIVTATNSIGESVASTAVSATPATVPEVPTDVETAPGNTEVTVSWTAPSDTGGADITDYTVYWGTEATVTVAPDTNKKSTGTADTSLTITGLTNGTMYYFIVTATNSAGESVATTAVSATPATVAPDAPTDVATSPGNTEVTVSWTAPSDTGGADITDYTVYWDTEAAVTTDTTTKKSTGNGSVTSLTITGLTNGLSYYFIVTATNSIGESVATTAVSATPATVPEAPTAVAAVSGPGAGEVTVTWTAPSDTGGADITDYTVYWDTKAIVTVAPDTNKKSTGNADTSLLVDGLINGLSYYFIVTATNSAGESLGSSDEATVERLGYALAEGGTFKMGSPDDDKVAHEDEKPQHDVTVSPFYISKYETTHAEYIEFLNSAEVAADGSKDGVRLINMYDDTIAVENIGGKFRFKEDVTIFPTSDTPVAHVTWYGAVEYANWLSNQAGLTPVYTINGTSVTPSWDANGYRLPTEAEWEYAARGGASSEGYTYAGSNNADDVGWHEDNNEGSTHPVGQKKDNELGLYDMSGNVLEWCWDWHGVYSSVNQPDPAGPSTGARRVLRGGSWRYGIGGLRPAYRGDTLPGFSSDYYGFRLARPAVL